MQTVKDFVTNPISGYTPIDNTVQPLPDYMVSGVAAPVAQLQYVPTIEQVTSVPTPWRYLWRRPFTRLAR